MAELETVDDGVTNYFLPTLYKKVNGNKIEEWTIAVLGNGSFYTSSGHIDGVKTTSKPTVCEPMNVGKKNATTAVDQAAKEAKAKWDKQIKKGYTETVENVDEALPYQVMLAKSYDDYADDITWPAYTQPKLDGIRCRINKDGMWTRNNEKIVSCPHINSALESFFEKCPDVQLDGELYNHEFKDNFNRIVELVKRQKIDDAQLAESKKYIQFWCYDNMVSGNFIDRLKFFKQYNTFGMKLIDMKYVTTVETHTVNSQEEVQAKLSAYLKEGYEGLMLRRNTAYENKRSKNLLKLKKFIDSEYEIVNVVEGEGNKSGMAGAFTLVMSDGRHFNSNIMGTHEYLVRLWESKDSLIGKQVTIQYFNLTPDGVPRFPYAKALRDYE